MKKLLLTAAAVLAVAAAWGTDLNPVAGRAEATGNEGVYPWCEDPKLLWLLGDLCPDMQLVDKAYDDKFWNYADNHDPKQQYLYQMYKFVIPEGYSTGTLRWRIWGNSGFETKLWLWNKATKTWVNIGNISGTFPSVQTYGPIPDSAFGDNDDLYVMATVQEGVTTHNIIADLIDIQY